MHWACAEMVKDSDIPITSSRVVIWKVRVLEIAS